MARLPHLVVGEAAAEPGGDPFLEAYREAERGGYDHEREDGGEQQAADHHHAHRCAPAAITRQAERDRHHAGDHRHGGHHDRLGALVASIHDRLLARHALAHLL